MSIKISGAEDKVQIEFIYSGTGLNSLLPSVFPPRRSVATFPLDVLHRRQKELCHP